MLSAGDLVNSLFVAGQDVPEALQKLASKDPRFRKGQKKAAGRGGGRGRGRPGQVGGAGLGFGNNAYVPGTSKIFATLRWCHDCTVLDLLCITCT